VSDELLLVVEASFVVTKRGLVVLPPIETSRAPSTISRAIVARVEHEGTTRTLEAVISLEHSYPQGFRLVLRFPTAPMEDVPIGAKVYEVLD
jgi:hypothetical protein